MSSQVICVAIITGVVADAVDAVGAAVVVVVGFVVVVVVD